MGSVRSKTVIGNPISNEEEFRASNFQMLDNVLKFAKEQMYTNSMRNSEKYPAERALLLEEVEQARLQKRHLIRLSHIHCIY